MAEITLELHSPITEEEWDTIADVDLDNTPRVVFHTKHGKDVEFVKVVRCKDCKWIDLCKDPEVYEYKGRNGFCSLGKRKDEVENG